MAQTFQHSDGDIAAVLRTMFESGEFDASLGSKFKDPMHYVVSAVRLAYDGKPISDLAANVELVEPPGRGAVRPSESRWISARWKRLGKFRTVEPPLRNRARDRRGKPLFDPEDGTAATRDRISAAFASAVFDAVAPFLSAQTSDALTRAIPAGVEHIPAVVVRNSTTMTARSVICTVVNCIQFGGPRCQPELARPNVRRAGHRDAAFSPVFLRGGYDWRTC